MFDIRPFHAIKRLLFNFSELVPEKRLPNICNPCVACAFNYYNHQKKSNFPLNSPHGICAWFLFPIERIDQCVQCICIRQKYSFTGSFFHPKFVEQWKIICFPILSCSLIAQTAVQFQPRPHVNFIRSERTNIYCFYEFQSAFGLSFQKIAINWKRNNIK